MTYDGLTTTYRPVLSDVLGGTVVQSGQSWFFQFWYRDLDHYGAQASQSANGDLSEDLSLPERLEAGGERSRRVAAGARGLFS